MELYHIPARVIILYLKNPIHSLDMAQTIFFNLDFNNLLLKLKGFF